MCSRGSDVVTPARIVSVDTEFWHQRWQANQIGFHESHGNALLVRHCDRLELETGGRVFVPLCGKTRDIAWLLSKGFRVAGAELSGLAVQDLFEDLGIEPQVTQLGDLRHFSASGIDVFVGDIFDLSPKVLGPIDAVFDRAAFVALPQTMRVRYARHLVHLTRCATQLLITFEYDQTVMPGPPFSITQDEVFQHYQEEFEISALESVEVKGGLKGKCPAKENVWLLRQASPA